MCVNVKFSLSRRCGFAGKTRFKCETESGCAWKCVHGCVWVGLLVSKKEKESESVCVCCVCVKSLDEFFNLFSHFWVNATQQEKFAL